MLKGTEKQIKWAEAIRCEVVRVIDFFEEVNKAQETYSEEILDEMVVQMRQETTESDESVFYIENFKMLLDCESFDESETMKEKLEMIKDFMSEDSLYVKKGGRGRSRAYRSLEE